MIPALSETIQLGIPKQGKYLPTKHLTTASDVIFFTGYICTYLENPSRTTNKARFPWRLRTMGPTKSIRIRSIGFVTI
jgi:hypothetical protein